MAEPTKPLAPVIRTMSPGSGMAMVLLSHCPPDATDDAATQQALPERNQACPLPLIMVSVLLYYVSARILWLAVATGRRQPQPHRPSQEGKIPMTPQLRILLATAIVPLAIGQAPVALAQQTKVTPLMAQPLPGFSGPEKEGSVALVEFPPGASSAAHR